ncbi:MAG TPA: hypothetical protein VGH08_01800 [Chthoniobacterales bacterium]
MAKTPRGAGALRPHGSAVEFGKILDDGEPKTEPTVQTRTGSVCLAKTIKT